MTLFLVVVAGLVTAGAAIAVTFRVTRIAVLGLLVVLVGTPFVADPPPDVLAMGARIVAGVLAGYAIWAALRGTAVPTGGSGLGWPGTGAVAIALFAGGWLAAMRVGASLAAEALEGPGTGAIGAALAEGAPLARSAFAAGVALLALAVGPVLLARDALRLVVGLLLLIAGASLVDASLHRPSETSWVVVAALTAGTGLAGASLLRRAMAGPTADLSLHEPPVHEAAIRSRAADDAHPMDPRRRASPGGRRDVDGSGGTS